MMEEKREPIEIVELDARLDMALDPIGMLGDDMWGGTSCGNGCCNGACGGNCGSNCTPCC
jgi:hypothetical protein